MGYVTPLWVRPTGFYNADGNFCRTGSRTEPGVPVPNPARHMPKPGHWRTCPGGKHRMSPRKSHGGPMWPSQMPQPFKPHTRDDLSPAGVRAQVRLAVELGAIAPEHAPSWAQPLTARP